MRDTSLLTSRRGDRLLTAAEVADRLCTTERYVWTLGRRGILPRVILPGGRLVRFQQSDVDAMIAAGRSSEPAPHDRPTSKAKRAARMDQTSLRF
jgi:predicted DNA-binding transcriptional regulator AlpA